MSFNWDEKEKEANIGERQFKDYCPNGEYTVKLAGVKLEDSPGWKSPALTFEWAEDETYRYPKSVRHWLSQSNASWRQVHNRNLLMAFGLTKDKAQQFIEQVEKDQDRTKLGKAYEALYRRLAERRPETKIVVQDQLRDGKPVISDKGTVYGESDFATYGCRVMPIPEAANSSTDIDMVEIPF